MLCKRLKHVVLFYSTFSPGWVLEKSESESPIAVALAHSFNLFYSSFGVRDAVVMEALAEARAYPDRFQLDKGFPPRDIWFFDDCYGVANRVSKHMKYNRSEFSIKYLFKMFSLGKKLNHRILLVLPPYRRDYRAEFDAAGGDRYSGLCGLQMVGDQKAKPEVLDFYDDMAFDFEDFGDFDHLNPAGRGVSNLTRSIKANLFEYGRSRSGFRV
jgi:hypothetical protein